jgi:hypothetical protein
MPFCNVNLLFSSSVVLRNLFGSVDRHLVCPRARRSRNERYFSKPNLVQNKKCIRFLVYVALWFVCGANNNHPNHPNRSTLSCLMTEQEVHLLAFDSIELTYSTLALINIIVVTSDVSSMLFFPQRRACNSISTTYTIEANAYAKLKTKL